MRLPAELRVLIYRAVSNDCDPFYMMRYLLHGDSHRYWTSSVDPAWESLHDTKSSAKAMLPLLMTSRQIQAEALPVLSGLKLCVTVRRGRSSWRAAVVRDTTEHVTPFNTTFNRSPAFYEWPSNTPSCEQEVLLKCFSSLTLSVSLRDYVMLAINISFGDQISVDVCLHPHPSSGEEIYKCRADEYVENDELNEIALAKLKAKTLRRVKASKCLCQELVQDTVGDLSSVGWHAFPRKRESAAIFESSSEYETVWHISVPGTSAHEEKKLRDMEADMLC